MATIYVAKAVEDWHETSTNIGSYSTKEKAAEAILAFLSDLWEIEPMELDSKTYTIKDYLEGLE